MDVDTALYIATEFDVEMKKVSKLQKEIRHSNIRNKTCVKILKKKDEEILTLKEEFSVQNEKTSADHFKQLQRKEEEIQSLIERTKDNQIQFDQFQAQYAAVENEGDGKSKALQDLNMTLQMQQKQLDDARLKQDTMEEYLI